MSDKILEAIKALGGDLSNARQRNCLAGELRQIGEYDFMITSCEDFAFTCTTDEFNAAAQAWLKEAYMYNAALSCNWDIEERDAVTLISNGLGDVKHHDVYVCRKEELIEYCEENKPKASPYDVDAHYSGLDKPVLTEAMLLPPVGSEVKIVDDGSLVYGQGESGEVVGHIENCAIVRMSYGLGCFTERYLREIKTIIVNGFEVPAPVREPLKLGEDYFVPSVTCIDFIDCDSWDGYETDETFMSRGLIHRTKAAAAAHAKAMCGIDPNADA